MERLRAPTVLAGARRLRTVSLLATLLMGLTTGGVARSAQVTVETVATDSGPASIAALEARASLEPDDLDSILEDLERLRQ